MTITEFLEARIAEDEATAQAEDEDYADTTLLPTYDSEHQATWHTDRVRAECAAKRAIIGLHSGENDTRCQSWNGNFVEEPCETLRALAAVYAGYPDYQKEWAL